MTTMPNKDEILRIHYQLVEMFIEEEDPIIPPGPRDEGLLESAASRPYTGIGNSYKYNTFELKAAALFHSLIQNHPFHNGNKRTALVSLLVALDRNYRRLDASDDEVFNFVVSVAGRLEPFHGSADDVVEEISNWIRRSSVTINPTPREMKVIEFLERCKTAGLRVRLSSDKGRWVILNPTTLKTIRFRKSNKILAGQVVKRYLRDLGLSEAQSGIYLDEFQNGALSQQQLLIQYRSVLKRLAYA